MTGDQAAALPAFRYHPDPVATGSVVPEAGRCGACGKERSHRYVGPSYGDEDPPEALCPWCIADGTAAERFGLLFTDILARDDWSALTAQLRDELLHRTPGFSGWQPERWLPHHGVPAVYLGPQGIDDLRLLGPDAVEAVRAEAAGSGLPPDAVDGWMAALARDRSPTAYLFRCETCSAYVGYSDDR
ncbi:MAG: CbrC family protein [Frankiaceae bacterium]